MIKVCFPAPPSNMGLKQHISNKLAVCRHVTVTIYDSLTHYVIISVILFVHLSSHHANCYSKSFLQPARHSVGGGKHP